MSHNKWKIPVVILMLLLLFSVLVSALDLFPRFTAHYTRPSGAHPPIGEGKAIEGGGEEGGGRREGDGEKKNGVEGDGRSETVGDVKGSGKESGEGKNGIHEDDWELEYEDGEDGSGGF
ncbi:MAG: hypothetical protein QW323_03085 [Candidatus Bathyarchaeia archaeon]